MMGAGKTFLSHRKMSGGSEQSATSSMRGGKEVHFREFVGRETTRREDQTGSGR